MVSYYDIRYAQNAARALQGRLFRGRKLDIRYSIPKVLLTVPIPPVCMTVVSFCAMCVVPVIRAVLYLAYYSFFVISGKSQRRSLVGK